MLKDFLAYQAQTTPHPLGMEVSHAIGSFVYDTNQKAYLDFVAGVSACSLGHCHPKVVAAIKNQLDKYMHVMVYGEYAQEPAVALAKLLASKVPDPLDTLYLTNSGTEAIEGAIKLARRVTGKKGIVAANNAYHGSTLGAMSLLGVPERTEAFKPLLPECSFINFNRLEDLDKITQETAAVVLETIQGGAGFILPEPNYLQAVRKRCDQTGSLLILDEIQPGFGRTGKLFGFEHFKIVPDILVMGKGMGGGMPIGAFMAAIKHMELLQYNPKLGHITTFGGHPVIAAAALATLQTILADKLMTAVTKKEQLFRNLLVHPLIKEVRGKGLMLAIILETADLANQLVLKSKDAGLILFWLLFESKAVRITPPLTISESEIRQGCQVVLSVLDELNS